ncbi:hypothetical protein HG530_013059 [Fusarium avenaceum]|nr:hypothetical protein HG530_013059 [Fusarium avenaceum]
MIPWVVDSISVSTVNIGGVTDSLYANGRMQVPVNVLVSARIKDTTIEYTLSPEKLQLVVLRNRHTDAVLVGDWTYSTIKNDYDHVISSVSLDGSAVGPMGDQNAASDDKGQTIQFWVSTTEVARMEIVASIHPPGEDDRSSSNKSPNDSSVILTGIPPITYTADSITIQKAEVETGQYKLEWEKLEGLWDVSWPRYWQTNHYVSLKNQNSVRKIKIFGLRRPEDERLRNCFAYWASDLRNLRIYYIWDKGPVRTRQVGHYINTSIQTFWGSTLGRKAHAVNDAVVNQNPKAICMTVMYYECEDKLWGPQWYDDCGFELYDRFGNYGKLSVTFIRDEIIIND